MARTSKKKLAIYDDGILLASDVDSIDFAGSGVVASIIGRAVTTTIAGGGGGGGTGYQAATGTVNGSNTVFSFSTAPSSVSVDFVPLQKTSKDGTVNWTGTTTITLTVAPNFDIFGLN